MTSMAKMRYKVASIQGNQLSLSHYAPKSRSKGSVLLLHGIAQDAQALQSIAPLFVANQYDINRFRTIKGGEITKPPQKKT